MYPCCIKVDFRKSYKEKSFFSQRKSYFFLLILGAFLGFSVGQQNVYAGYPSQTGTEVGNTFSSRELVESGHSFFGNVSKGLASAIESAVGRLGQPNGYILGQEASGAFLLGLRYGEGKLHTRNAGSHPIFWQGPSLGFDVGADGARIMILVYNLPDVPSIYRRFGGVNGSAYVVAGFGISVLNAQHVNLVLIRSGVGGRLGINGGYLHFTPQPSWIPF